MKAALFASVLLAVLAGTGSAEPSAREKALARVDSLIEADELENAEHLLEHLLNHNPGDPGLLKLRAKLRIRQGKLGDLLRGGDDLLKAERRSDLRAACWRIVEATAPGNPEEFVSLLDTGDPERARAILTRLAGAGSAEQKRVAVETLARAGDAEALKAIEERVRGGDLAALLVLPDDRLAAHGKLVADALGSPRPSPAACAAAARLGLAAARPLLRKLVEGDDPRIGLAAAGALLAMGDETARRVLEKAYASGKPVEVVPALTHLAAHPKPGKGALPVLLKQVEENPPVARLKPELVEIVLDALGRRGGPGVRGILEAHLQQPGTAMAAARALGRLGDPTAVPAVLAFLREPPKETGTEEAAGGGLGFLGRGSEDAEAASRALELQPRLVGALSLLRLTRRLR